MPLNVTTTPSSSHAKQQVNDKEAPSSSSAGEGAHTVNVRDYEENTPLIVEAAAGNEDAVRSLLSRGANVDAQNMYGYTALLSALSRGFVPLALTLLDFGANVHLSCLEGLSPLHMAVIHCNEAVVTKILQCGAFLGVQDEEGDSLLHWAVREGKHDMLSLLLNKLSFFADIKNSDGETALHLAAALGDEVMAEALLKGGASQDVKDGSGQTPMDHAGENAQYKIVHLLAKAKRQGSGANNTRYDPYRRASCAETHERKHAISMHHYPSLTSSAHLF